MLIELAAVHRTLRQRDEAEKIYKWILRRRTDSFAARVGLAAIYKDKKGLKDGLKLCGCENKVTAYAVGLPTDLTRFCGGLVP